jgi:hypothetical protein
MVGSRQNFVTSVVNHSDCTPPHTMILHTNRSTLARHTVAMTCLNYCSTVHLVELYCKVIMQFHVPLRTRYPVLQYPLILFLSILLQYTCTVLKYSELHLLELSIQFLSIQYSIVPSTVLVLRVSWSPAHSQYFVFCCSMAPRRCRC